MVDEKVSLGKRAGPGKEPRGKTGGRNPGDLIHTQPTMDSSRAPSAASSSRASSGAAGHTAQPESPAASDALNFGQSPCAGRVSVKRWSACAGWSWDIGINSTCAICRNEVMELCIECQASYGASCNEQCTLAWGGCGVSSCCFNSYIVGITNLSLHSALSTYFISTASQSGCEAAMFARWTTRSGHSSVLVESIVRALIKSVRFSKSLLRLETHREHIEWTV